MSFYSKSEQGCSLSCVRPKTSNRLHYADPTYQQDFRYGNYYSEPIEIPRSVNSAHICKCKHCKYHRNRDNCESLENEKIVSSNYNYLYKRLPKPV
ncbi:hypothetical protein A3Q56_00966 [Intoshia linei]|uniref:Uncharacterized protein n=1 Tax=Intoshia linei TaxID=1819745 RepID=A0A177BAL4_9BILA|nr:hypothetical protein A3Q56_00966 [Intoshia linei]